MKTQLNGEMSLDWEWRLAHVGDLLSACNYQDRSAELSAGHDEEQSPTAAVYGI